MCFSIPFLVEPFLKPFLKPSRLFELEAVNSKLQILPEKFWSAKKSTRVKWSISLLHPFKKVHFMYAFQLGNSFVNTKVPRKFTLCIRFQFGNSFVNTKVPRKFTLCIRFQLGNSFVNTKVPRKFTVCIRFQLDNSFGNT